MLFYILSCLGSATVSAEAWRAILYLFTLDSISRGLAGYSVLFYIISCLDRICRGLACSSISYHALAVFAEAWHAIPYLITQQQYLPKDKKTELRKLKWRE